MQADMSRSEDVVRPFETVKAAHGRLDILVNNAGFAIFEMVADMTEDAFHKHFNVNVLGYFLAIREALKVFGDEGGSIINISSILSTDPYLASSVYAATKDAVDTMTFALARELGPRGIRVNSILPGHTNTPATDGNFTGELGERLLAGTPLGRFGEPEDIAPVAVFLASDDAHSPDCFAVNAMLLSRREGFSAAIKQTCWRSPRLSARLSAGADRGLSV